MKEHVQRVRGSTLTGQNIEVGPQEDPARTFEGGPQQIMPEHEDGDEMKKICFVIYLLSERFK